MFDNSFEQDAIRAIHPITEPSLEIMQYCIMIQGAEVTS